MTRWVVGGAVLVAGVGAVAWLGGTRTGPEIVVNAPVTPEPAPPVPPPAEPVVLARVVDVTDIEGLLDPVPIPAAEGAPAGPVLTAVGYEEPAAPVAPTGDVPPIPPAAEDDDAPVPVTAEELDSTGPRYWAFTRPNVKSVILAPASVAFNTGYLALPTRILTPLDQLPCQPPDFVFVGDVICATPVPSRLGALPVESVRTGWYGDALMLPEQKYVDFWADWTPFPPGFAPATWPHRVGLFF